MNFDEEMNFDEIMSQIGRYMFLDTVQGYIQARKLLRWARESGKFTEPHQRERMGRIGGNITMYGGDAAIREYPKREGFQPDDSDFEDEDDLEDDEDDPAVFIQWSPEKGVEYISG
jgi:hypothetical protein